MVASAVMDSRPRLPDSPTGSARKGDGGEGIKVVVRTRPADQFEMEEKDNKVCFTVATEKTCILDVQGKSDPYSFTFDRILGEQSQQIEVFKAIGAPMIEHVLSGFNSTMLVYGQTGAGKTHTMLGDLDSEEMRGLAPRMFEYLFSRIAEEQTTMATVPEYGVTSSSLEIYNETITDLLNPSSKNLQLRRSANSSTTSNVDGLKEVEIKNTRQALKYLKKGAKSRSVSATNANLTSSRSHLVFSCVVTRRHKEEDGSEVTRSARLNLVDLAGSESAKASVGKDAKTLKENRNINKSLTCLGRVIKALVDSQKKGGKKVHVPYRESKLTALLQESLGGNALTTIVAGVSPMHSASWESLSTLQFVQRAKHIRNKAAARQSRKVDTHALQLEVLQLRSQLEKCQKEGRPVDECESPETGSPSAESACEDALFSPWGQGSSSRLEDRFPFAPVAEENAQLQSRQLQSGICSMRRMQTELRLKTDEMKKTVDLQLQSMGADEARMAELGCGGACNGEMSEDYAELKAKITELEREKAELTRAVSRAEMTVKQLDSEKRELHSEIKLVESQRCEAEKKLACYIAFGERLREEVNVLNSDFGANEIRAEAELKARDVQLDNTAMHSDDKTHRLANQHLEASPIFDVPAPGREESSHGVLHRPQNAAECQMRTLEDQLSKLEAAVEERQSTIEQLQKERIDLIRSHESELKEEKERSVREMKEIKEELEAVIRASEVQMDAAERQRAESKRQFENDILSRDQLITILQQQLSERDGVLQGEEEHGVQTPSTIRPNNALFNGFQITNNAIAAENPRPASAISFDRSLNERGFLNKDATRTNSGNRKSSPVRCRNGTDSAFRPFQCRRGL